jgi:hypothetical protein
VCKTNIAGNNTVSMKQKSIHSYLFLHKALFFTGQILLQVALRGGITLNKMYLLQSFSLPLKLAIVKVHGNEIPAIPWLIYYQTLYVLV